VVIFAFRHDLVGVLGARRQYESYIDPLIILMTVPTAMLGALASWRCAARCSTSTPRWGLVIA